MGLRAQFLARHWEIWEDGQEYPVVKVEVTSDSHPFFTGKEKLLDTEGRIDRFRKRYAGGRKEGR